MTDGHTAIVTGGWLADTFAATVNVITFR